MNKIGIFIAITTILGGLGFLLFGQLEKNIVYFLTPSELLAKEKAAIDQPVRLGGTVKLGSITWDANRTTLQFLLTDGTREILVSSSATPPQMFQEKMGIVVEGKLVAAGHFQADRLMVKHSNEYHPPKEGAKPAIIYKELISPN